MTSLNFSVTTPRSFQQPLCKPPNCNDLSSYTIYDYNEEQLNISTKHRQTYEKILIGTTNVQPKIMSLNYAYCKLFNVSNNQHISSTNYLLAVYIYKKLILWSRTAEKPYQCSDCDKRFTPINLQFKGMKYKYDECSELFISEMTQTQQLFNSFILSMNYINVIYNKLLMTLVEHGKTVIMHGLWLGLDKCIYKSANPANGTRTWRIQTRKCSFHTRCVYNCNFLKVSHNLQVYTPFKC